MEGVFSVFFTLNGKLGNYGNDIVMGKLLSINDNYILDLFKTHLSIIVQLLGN